MPDEYRRLCELYQRDIDEDTVGWRVASRIVDEIIEALRVEFGLTRPLREIYVASPRDPDEAVPSYMALEVTAVRSWNVLLSVVLRSKGESLDWLGAHFRFPLELRVAADDACQVRLWPGAAQIRVRMGDLESYEALSSAVASAIETKLRDPKAQGPERIRRREVRRDFVISYQTSATEPETSLGRTYVGHVPRAGEAVVLEGGHYRVIDVVWNIEDASRTSVIVVVAAQPAPATPP